MEVPPFRGATQGRRFNGRPAVSKTASGGSNPSAPAKSPRTIGSKARRIVYGCRREKLGRRDEGLLQRFEVGDAPRHVAEPQTGGIHDRGGNLFRLCVCRVLRGGGLAIEQGPEGHFGLLH